MDKMIATFSRTPQTLLTLYVGVRGAVVLVDNTSAVRRFSHRDYVWNVAIFCPSTVLYFFSKINVGW